LEANNFLIQKVQQVQRKKHQDLEKVEDTMMEEEEEKEKVKMKIHFD
jgi:hypothetical protein